MIFNDSWRCKRLSKIFESPVLTDVRIIKKSNTIDLSCYPSCPMVNTGALQFINRNRDSISVIKRTLVSKLIMSVHTGHILR